MSPSLLEDLTNRKGRSAIVGLGYVGEPILRLAHERGLPVVGLDVDERRVRHLAKDGITATTDPAEALRDTDIIVICVPTPVDPDDRPDLRFVLQVTHTIRDHLVAHKPRRPPVVILESTVAPGTVEEVLAPIFQEAGFESGRDIHLAHCPERIDPGNAEWTVANIPRVVGGMDPEGTELATAFYRSFLDGQILPVSSVRAAEAVKIVENTFRDVNIAFVNELAMSFDRLGIDVTEVLRGAATKPFGFLAHWPGAGVGGHCIAVDPYYLIERAGRQGFNHRFLKIAREINDGMPTYTVQRTLVAMNELGRSIKGSRIAVLGVAYKPNIPDTRESPAHEVIRELEALGGDIVVYDPHVPDESTVRSLDEALEASQCAVLLTAHKEFLEIGPDQFKAAGVAAIVDGRNAYDKQAMRDAGLAYYGIGRA